MARTARCLPLLMIALPALLAGEACEAAGSSDLVGLLARAPGWLAEACRRVLRSPSPGPGAPVPERPELAQMAELEPMLAPELVPAAPAEGNDAPSVVVALPASSLSEVSGAIERFTEAAGLRWRRSPWGPVLRADLQRSLQKESLGRVLRQALREPEVAAALGRRAARVTRAIEESFGRQYAKQMQSFPDLLRFVAETRHELLGEAAKVILIQRLRARLGDPSSVSEPIGFVFDRDFRTAGGARFRLEARFTYRSAPQPERSQFAFELEPGDASGVAFGLVPVAEDGYAPSPEIQRDLAELFKKTASSAINDPNRQ